MTPDPVIEPMEWVMLATLPSASAVDRCVVCAGPAPPDQSRPPPAGTLRFQGT